MSRIPSDRRPFVTEIPLAGSVPAVYRPLHKYLAGRFADVVVLKFTEVEDILGCALPAEARLAPGWWATAAPGDEPAPQSLSWVNSQRSALANLQRGVVQFERISS